MARLSSGPEGGYAISSPLLEPIQYTYNLSAASLNANTPQQISRVNGHHRITLTYNVAGVPYTWSFALTGGTNAIVSTYNPHGNPNNFMTAAGDPPRGCTVTVLLPPPHNTTLKNVFQVTETITGLGLIFVFAYCPDMGIPSTILYPSGQAALTSSVTVNFIFYRNPNLFVSSGYSISMQGPEYYIQPYTTPFISSGGVNPLDAHTPLPFSSVSGQQTIVVSNTTTDFYFAFVVYAGGISAQGAGYIGYIYNPIKNSDLSGYIENATINSIIELGNPLCRINPVQYTITTVAPDSKTYILVFYPSQQQPTITLQTGTLGADSLDVTVAKHIYSLV